MSTSELSGAAAAMKSAAEKPSDNLGPAPRLDWIPLADLAVDPTYQRAMGKGNHQHANWILRNFAWIYYQPLVVAAPIDGRGRYTVIDGQHRLVAARKHPQIDKLPCYIVEGADVAAQAKAFATINGRRIGITRLQRYWAALAAKEPMAVRVAGLCHKAGVEVARTMRQNLAPRTTIATFTIEKMVKFGDASIVTALRTIGDAHGSTGDAFKASIVEAMIQLVVAQGAGFDRARMVAVLRDVNLEKEIQRAKATRARNGGSLAGSLKACLYERYETATSRAA